MLPKSIVIALVAILMSLINGSASSLAYDFTPVTTLIQNAVDTIPLPGASLLLIKDGQVIYEKAFGTYTMADASYGKSANPNLGGGVSLKLRDYGNFLQMVLSGGMFNGQRVLSENALREMARDQTNGAPITFSPYTDGRRYGLGVWRDIVDAQGHAVQISSQGLFGFSPWVDYKRNLIGVFLVQNNALKLKPVVNQMQQMIRDIIDKGQ